MPYETRITLQQVDNGWLVYYADQLHVFLTAHQAVAYVEYLTTKLIDQKIDEGQIVTSASRV